MMENLNNINKMQTTFFDTNNYFIDEKVNLFKFENCYKVFNEHGENIGTVNQKLSAGQKLLRLVLNKTMLPFHLDIKNNTGEIQSSIFRGWTFFMSKITITNSQGVSIAFIKQKFKFFKPKFLIFNNYNNIIAEITGDWKAWNFVIIDSSQNQIGTISKKWAGAMKEIFTSADKYNVSIDPNYNSMENKTAILSCAITIDMVLKESK